ncbi:MAG: hypothetical protein GY898_23370 [Proteobacteria bacterium]|nr:hypothetical protein [Pseudomonadota bacterium]
MTDLGRVLRVLRWIVSLIAMAVIGVAPGLYIVLWTASLESAEGEPFVVGLVVGGVLISLFLAGFAKLLFGPDVEATRRARQLGVQASPYDEVGFPSIRLRVPMPVPLNAIAQVWGIGEDVDLGDRRLDKAVQLRGPADLLVAALDERARLALGDIIELYEGTIRNSLGQVFVPLRAPRETAGEVLADLRRVASALAMDPAEVPDALATIAREGSMPRRRRAVAVMMGHHPRHPQATLLADELFAGDEYGLAKIAASALGREDVLQAIEARERGSRGGLSLSAASDDGGELSLAAEAGAGAGALSEAEES